MSNYILSVVSNAKEGREDEYNDWYDNIHLKEIAQLDGFANGQRFEPAEAGEGPTRYVALYEMDTDNPDQAMATLNAAVTGGKLNMTDSIDGETIQFTVYRVRTPKVTA